MAVPIDPASACAAKAGAAASLEHGDPQRERGLSRTVVFWIQIVYLALLTVIAYVAAKDALDVPDYFGPFPRGVPWFGALGGVLISLAGVFEHRGADWDPSYWPWHVSRPLVGAVVAIVAVLAFQSGVLAINATPPEQGSESSFLFYYLIAFVVGYREEAFRRLVKRLADVILEPGGEQPAANDKP